MANNIDMGNKEMKSWEMGAKLGLNQMELNDAACREEWLRADRRRLIKEERFYRGERERLLEEVEKKEKIVKEKGKEVKKWMAHVQSTTKAIGKLRVKADVSKEEIQKLESIKMTFQNKGSAMQKDVRNLISDKIVLKQNLKAKDDEICKQLEDIKKLVEDTVHIVSENRKISLANEKLEEENAALKRKARKSKLPKMPKVGSLIRHAVQPLSGISGFFTMKPFLIMSTII